MFIFPIVVMAAMGCHFDWDRTCADGKNSREGGTYLDGRPPVSCTCEDPGVTRCAGNTIEECAQGRWRDLLQCADPFRCVSSRCVRVASGCPDRGDTTGATYIVDYITPVLVSQCIAAGDTRRDVSYYETVQETHTRTVSVALQDCPGGKLDFSLGEIFGVDVDGQVSSSTSSVLALTGRIPAGQYGAWYRQTQRIHRVATLWRGAAFVGTATLTDWQFVAELAVGPSCLPPTSLPGPQTAAEPICTTWQYGCSCDPE
jgi:hypothetical protein